jgi:hypothetical protein
MLFGCYAISRALAVTPGQQMKLLALMGVLNVYEFLLIAGAVILISRAGQLADGRTLLLMEIPFLFDVAFLHSELAVWSGGLSLMTASTAALLAAGKMLLLSRYLHWPSERRVVGLSF